MQNNDPLLALGGFMPIIQPDACLWFIGRAVNGTIVSIAGHLGFAET